MRKSQCGIHTFFNNFFSGLPIFLKSLFLSTLAILVYIVLVIAFFVVFFIGLGNGFWLFGAGSHASWWLIWASRSELAFVFLSSLVMLIRHIAQIGQERINGERIDEILKKEEQIRKIGE